MDRSTSYTPPGAARFHRLFLFSSVSTARFDFSAAEACADNPHLTPLLF
jgi:hypothetical protein